MINSGICLLKGAAFCTTILKNLLLLVNLWSLSVYPWKQNQSPIQPPL